jgi:Phytochelatin synthase
MARSIVKRRVARAALAALALLAVLSAYPAFLIARARFFPRQYPVQSIALLPEYQDPTLVEHAWTLPVAARFGHTLEPQRNVSVCGLASAANVFRSLGTGPMTASAVAHGTGRCRVLGYCWKGLTLDELAEVIRSKTDRSVTVLRDLTLAAFRAQLARANDPGRRYIVNFHRGLLFGQGAGHHSPIGGYLPERDLVFVLDVNARYGPWLVATERLYRAMDSVDPESGKKRGLLLIE